MTETYERCSCGARDRAKCSKESLSGCGKMCVKELKSRDEMTQEQQALIDRALSRKNLGREEQRRLGLELKDALTLNTYQAQMIREMRDEIIKLKIHTNEDRSSAIQNK